MTIIERLKRLPKQEKRITLATKITLLRASLIPFIIYSMVTHYWGAAFWLFLVAALSDMLDGGLARLRNEKTLLGACLDPIVDKLLILSVYITLAFIQSPLFSIPLTFVSLVLVKEIVQIIGVLTLFGIGRGIKVEPTLLGKVAMVVQVLFIVWLFACYFFNWLPFKTYQGMLFSVLAIILASLIQYCRLGIIYFRLGYES